MASARGPMPRSGARATLHALAPASTAKGSRRSITRITCVAVHFPSPRAVGIFLALRPSAMARRDLVEQSFLLKLLSLSHSPVVPQHETKKGLAFPSYWAECGCRHAECWKCRDATSRISVRFPIASPTLHERRGSVQKSYRQVQRETT